MFKKRKEKRAQELNESQLKVEQKFAADIEKASHAEVADPAQKVIALQEIRQAIGEKLRSERIDRNESARRAGFKMNMGFIAASSAGYLTMAGLTLAAGVLTPVAAIASATGGVAILAGAIANPLRKNAVKKKLEKGAEGHIEKMKDLQTLADQKTNDIWVSNRNAIEISPLFNEASYANAVGREWGNVQVIDSVVEQPKKKFKWPKFKR